MQPAQRFTDLIRAEEWRRVQDAFSEIAGAGMRTLDADGREIACSGEQPFLKKSCLPTFLGGDSAVDKNLSFVCPPGFHNFVAPLRHSATGAALAYVMMGPVILVMRKSRDDYKPLAEELGLSPEEFWDICMRIRVVSFHRAQSLINLVRQIGEYVLKLACDKVTSIGDLLKVILDAAVQLSGADIGSVLFMEKNEQEMTIRAAQGLSDAVVKNTRVKVGEGLSGRAVSENRPILIDADEPVDQSIARHLNRPYLKSSMILPIEMEKNAHGCLNLGALEVSPVRFNQANLDTVQRLIGLTKVLSLFTVG